MRGKSRHVLQRRRMHRQQTFITRATLISALNSELDSGPASRKVPGKSGRLSRRAPPFSAVRIADQIEIRIRLPTLAGKSLPALLGWNRGISPGICVGKHRVVGLVHGHRRGRGAHRRARRTGFRRRALTATCRDGQGQPHDQNKQPIFHLGPSAGRMRCRIR